MKKLLIFGAVLLILTAAAPALAESILVITDTHLQAGTGAFDDAREAVIAAARSRDLVLMLGDGTNNGHMEEHMLVLDFARRIREEVGAEVLIIPGNHDYSSRFGAQQFRTVYEACGPRQAYSLDAASAGCAVMTRNGVCLLMLDTNRTDPSRHPLPDGGLDPETLAWVGSVLKALPADTPVIACGHHPILPADRDQRTPGTAALADLLRSYGVTLYLCGHDHGFYTLEENGLRQITVGQPQAYPGWAGVIETTDSGFSWKTEPLYAPDAPAYRALKSAAEALGVRMAEGTLEGTPYADDEGAITWFSSAFMQYAGGELTPESCTALLRDENSKKWLGIETRTVVKSWIFTLLEHCPEDVRQIEVRLRDQR